MPQKIIIADDEDMVREAVRLCLQDGGYEIYEAADGREALELARRILPDLMVLDVMMPGMAGYRVCTELKKDEATKNIFILFLTARGTQQAENTVIRSGGDEFMAKPFDPALLREKVKQALETEA
ncbi:MAG TPA: response regulator [bacterium]|nr:response regulator [bacterium]